jgi:uncharacterized protein YaiL (DUF2058 family)
VADQRVRIEVAFEAGQAFSALVDVAVADEIERRLRDGAEGVVHVEAEDGRYAVVLRRVAYLKRFARESRVGFGNVG